MIYILSNAEKSGCLVAKPSGPGSGRNINIPTRLAIYHWAEHSWRATLLRWRITKSEDETEDVTDRQRIISERQTLPGLIRQPL